MFENWQGCIVEEERKKRKKKGRRGRGGRGRERERERERESKGRHKREASISHFLRKMNYALSSLLKEEREREGGIEKNKKKKMMWHICFVLFFFLFNWSYFIMGLLYWSLILEAISFYGKKFWALFFLKKWALS
jgi:Flp pilus assembly protein TadB